MFGKVGHFTSMMWKASSKFAVGMAKCGDMPGYTGLTTVTAPVVDSNYMGQFAENVLPGTTCTTGAVTLSSVTLSSVTLRPITLRPLPGNNPDIYVSLYQKFDC